MRPEALRKPYIDERQPTDHRGNEQNAHDTSAS